jgi:hypothetical protein
MANEIGTCGPTGLTFYCTVEHPNGTVWNGSAFEAWTDGNYATYAITLTQQGTGGVRRGNFPATAPSSVSAGGPYHVSVRIRAGGSPVIGDPFWSGGSFDWNGTTEGSPAQALVNAGVTAARMQLLDAAQASWNVVGDVATWTTLDGLHTFSATFSPSITAPTSVTVVQLT